MTKKNHVIFCINYLPRLRLKEIYDELVTNKIKKNYEVKYSIKIIETIKTAAKKKKKIYIIDKCFYSFFGLC